jgi:sulfur carrier protein
MNDAIHVHLNGMPCRLATGTTLAALLDAEGLARRRVAVEVNGEIVSRGRHAQHLLADGDKVEIVHALGGG